MAKNQTVFNSPRRKSVATVDDLENLPGSPNTSDKLEAGDTCFVTSRQKEFICLDPTSGSAMWMGSDGELWTVDPSRGMGQFLSAGAPDLLTGTFGTVAHYIGTAPYSTPTAGDKIDITTDASALATVTFAGTENLAAAILAINTAAGYDVAFEDPYNAGYLVTTSGVAGDTSSLILANNTGTPLAALFGGGYTGGTYSGVSADPTLAFETFEGESYLTINADGMGTLSSAAFFVKERVAFQEFDMEFGFASYDGVTPTSKPYVSALFAGDAVKETYYAYAASVDGFAGIERSGDGALQTLSPAAGYNYLASLAIRGARGADSLPKFYGQMTGFGYTSSAWYGLVFTSETLYPYGTSWTTGDPPTNDRIGLSIASAGTALYRPIKVRLFNIGYRTP